MNIPQNFSHHNTLLLSGLSVEQALVYEALLIHGQMPASKISVKIPVERTLVYKILERLLEIGLVIKKDEPGKVAVFEASHPIKLKEWAEKKAELAKVAEQAVSGSLEKMTIDFNLATGRPGVRFFEGKEGIIQAYEFLLENAKTVVSFEEKGDMDAYFRDYVDIYIKKRVKRGIKSRTISPAVNRVNKTDPKLLLEVKTLPLEKFPFRMDIKIFDRYVLQTSFQKEHPVAILIDNQEIADNYRILFETFWKMIV